MKQHEIREKGSLLNDQGFLREKGWARKLLLSYDRKQIKSPWYRIKEWDYYAVLTPDYGIALTISDLGYIGYDAITWLDFKERSFYTKDLMRLFPRGKTKLPATSKKGISSNHGKNVFLEFNRESGTHILRFHALNKRKEHIFQGSLELHEIPDQDTMVIVTPWSNNSQAFYYNQKINCLQAKGEVRINGVKYLFDEGKAFGVLDWGRGVWTYKNTWYWASASGLVNDKCFGLNFGYGFGDTSAATENLILYDGKAHKLHDVTFHFNEKDYLEPWEFTSNDGRVNLKMQPILDRNSRTNLLVIKSDQHQVFGVFSGSIVLDSDETLKINNLMGFAEKVFNQW